MSLAAAVGLWSLALAAAAQPGVPALTGRVVDNADILSRSVEAGLSERLAAFEDSTSVQVVVLTVPSLRGAVLERFATDVFRTWGLGQAESDNGVLLLVARDDRELRIEVGYGLEGELTDALAGRIIRDEIVPRFRDGSFNGGVVAGVDAILGAVSGTYSPPQRSGILFNDRPVEEAPWTSRVMFALVFGLVPLVPIATHTLVAGRAGEAGDVAAGCSGLFAGPFVGGALVILLMDGWWLLAGLLGVPLALIGLNRWLEGHPKWGPVRRHNRAKTKAFAEARRRGDTVVVVGGRPYDVPVRSSSGSSGGGSGVGGFSGGGGSSGGGGASGSW